MNSNKQSADNKLSSSGKETSGLELLLLTPGLPELLCFGPLPSDFLVDEKMHIRQLLSVVT